MEDAISGHQWQSAEALDGGCNQWPSMAIGRSSVVISATLTCGIARIAWRHRRRGTLPASHPSSRISPSPRGSRREIAARSVDLPAIRGNQRQSAAMSGNERSSTVIHGHQRSSSRNQRSSSRNQRSSSRNQRSSSRNQRSSSRNQRSSSRNWTHPRPNAPRSPRGPQLRSRLSAVASSARPVGNMIRPILTSSEVISGNQRSSVAIRGHQW